jgi:menaquinone-dependent protoporphyrinogen oxidase
MSARILVAYATRYGSTAEIASAVGKELESAGHAVVVKEMKAVTSLEGYDAFVIGAPIYMGKVIDINTFVRRFKDTLARKPVAAFAVGLAAATKYAKQVEESRKALDTSLAPIKPVAVTLFAGMLDPAKLSFIQRKMTEFVKSPTGDFRDWNAIAAWARELPESMKR